ncbi:trypsin-like peptidase domain-containing protein [bacterium]|nr:trypsin-like peptidase domain-containing protein [bacterium]
MAVTSRLLTLVILPILTALLLGSVQVAFAQTNFDIDRIQRATVLVLQIRSFDDGVITCAGSGTLVSRDGLILTNAHHAVTNSDCPGQALIIAMSASMDQPPIARYRAEVTNANLGLDLALLRITGQLDGSPVDNTSFALPFVELADSSSVATDETIRIFGYPNMMQSSVEERLGTISGFVSEPSAQDRAWIKIESDVPGMMTGGGIYNANGQLIGVPTTIASATTSSSCPVLEDTNGDGLVNQNDRCVPVGGFINAARPANFARLLLRGASLGLSLSQAPIDPQFATTPGGEPAFSRLFFLQPCVMGCQFALSTQWATPAASICFSITRI